MTRFSQLFPLLLLAVLAGLTFWLDQAVQEGVHGNGAERHDPDYIAEKIIAHRMDANGDIKHTLYAERMTHYPDDDSTHLVSPRFVSNVSARAPILLAVGAAGSLLLAPQAASINVRASGSPCSERLRNCSNFGRCRYGTLFMIPPFLVLVRCSTSSSKTCRLSTWLPPCPAVTF